MNYKQERDAAEPWIIDEQAFPKHGTRAMQARFLLQYAILAPSGHNTQPWKFRIHNDCVEVFADYSRQLDVVDPRNRELMISCGAAIGMFCHAARNFGCKAHVTLTTTITHETPLATIELLAGPAADDYEQEMFQAIARRHTQRAGFYAVAPDIGDLAHCLSIAKDYDVHLFCGTESEQKNAIASLVANGDRVQYANPDFRGEFAHWLKARLAGNVDGISASSMGLPDILTPLGSLLVKSINVGGAIGESHRRQVKQPETIIGVMSSKQDEPGDWLSTGRALSHILLYLTSKGLSVCFYNEPIEIAPLRNELTRVVGEQGIPQLLFRIGYGPDGHTASRRHVEQCLIADD